jgi:hypothetical protein
VYQTHQIGLTCVVRSASPAPACTLQQETPMHITDNNANPTTMR